LFHVGIHRVYSNADAIKKITEDRLLQRTNRRAALTTTIGAACIAFAFSMNALPSAAQTSSAPMTPLPTQIPTAMPTQVPAGSAERLPPPAWVAFASAWNAISAYSAALTVFEQKGAQTQRVVFDYNFRKPSNATVHVVEGPNAGVTLVWNGGGTMEAHRGSGLAALFKKTLSLHDPLATTIRGSSIDQLSFGAILDHAQQTQGVVSQSNGPMIDGVATDELRLIPSSSVTNTGLSLEIIYLSKTTHFPLRVLGLRRQNARAHTRL
jgi:hypothetical protein